MSSEMLPIIRSRKPAQHIAGNAAILALIFLWFSAWAVVKPPFQAPDEFSHAIKAYASAGSPFITPEPNVRVSAQICNPLLVAKVLHEIPFHPASSVSERDIAMLKEIAWPEGGGGVNHLTNAFNYPYLYYLAVFVTGQGLSLVLDASPYDSFYLYRLASAFLSALAWLLVYRSLPESLLCPTAILVFLVINPMLAFMSSSINPDALFYPATCLVVIFFWRLAFTEMRGDVAWAALSAAALIKSAALVLFPALAALSTGILLLQRKMRFVRTLLVIGAAGATAFFAFYFWAPRPDDIPYAGTPVQILPWEYPLAVNYGLLAKSFWGVLGWLDYSLLPPYYWMIGVLLAINSACALIDCRDWLQIGLTWYALLFSCVFILGMFMVEYQMLPRYGYVLQGRYFLPAALGLAMLLVHRRTWARHALLLYLGVFSLLLYRESVDRYYDGNWARGWRALPFTAVLAEPPAPPYSFEYLPPSQLLHVARQGGSIDQAERKGNRLELRGWAPIRGDEEPVRYRIFTQEVPLEIAGRRDYRPDVARALNDSAYRKSGFVITLLFANEEQARTAAADFCLIAGGASGGEILLPSGNDGCRQAVAAFREGA